jgi:hypothetical protein
MTMYLPNRDIQPTGYEAGEFLELTTAAPASEPEPAARDGGVEEAPPP